MVNLIKDNKRGDLMAFDTMDIPFYVKRIFVVNNVPLLHQRGNHSHHSNQQYLICLNGVIKVFTYDGIEHKSFNLYKGDTFLLETKIWSRQCYMTENSELMVLCSHEYDKEDYITDFEEFKRLTNG